MEHPFGVPMAQHRKIRVRMDHIGIQHLAVKRQGDIHVAHQEIDAEPPQGPAIIARRHPGVAGGAFHRLNPFNITTF